jgi:hypothetical protein
LITPASRTDHEAVWELAQETDTDWAYLLWCDDYRRNAVVVTVDGRAAGFAIAKPAPKGAPEVVAVEIAPRYRRFGLRESLLKALGVKPDARPTGAA